MEAFLSSLHLLFSPVVQTGRKQFALYLFLNIFLEGKTTMSSYIRFNYSSFSIKMGLCLSPCVFRITFFYFIQCILVKNWYCITVLVYESALNSFFLSFILTNVWDLKKTI